MWTQRNSVLGITKVAFSWPFTCFRPFENWSVAKLKVLQSVSIAMKS